MGQTLSEPIKEKHSSDGQDDRLMFAASAMQGWRISMEDAHTTILELNDKKYHSFFGVFDGHGGQNVAKYSGLHLHERIARDDAYDKGEYELAIKNGFLGTDDDLKKDPDYANDPSGCTAVTALITPDNRIIVGNAGDSRAVLSIKGEAVAMSIDHKPVNKEENERIVKAGGFVEFGRVNGNLALSRAIGDFEFKQNTNLPAEEQIVTAFPETKESRIDQETEFLVLACDGIWDCLSSQEVISFIRNQISLNNGLRTAAENLMDRCLARDSELGGIGCDNMTVIIVAFLHGRSEKQWYEWIIERVNAGIGIPLQEEEKQQSSSPKLPVQEDYQVGEDEQDLEINEDATAEDHGQQHANLSQSRQNNEGLNSDVRIEDSKKAIITPTPTPPTPPTPTPTPVTTTTTTTTTSPTNTTITPTIPYPLDQVAADTLTRPFGSVNGNEPKHNTVQTSKNDAK